MSGEDDIRAAGETGTPIAAPEPLPEDLAQLSRNDLGNAERLIQRRGRDLLHNHSLGWIVWDGRRWQMDSSAKAFSPAARLVAHDVAERIGEEVQHVDENQRRAHAKWALDSGNNGRLNNMLECAAPRLQVKPDELDVSPDLLNVENGTLELGLDADDRATVRLAPHARADRITHVAPVRYDPDAPRPERFWSFYQEILPDHEIGLFVQRWLGYCLTGHASEQKIACFWGGGANGKSTLLSIVRRLMGDYTRTLEFSSLAANDRRNGSQPTPDLARLLNARIVTAAEPDKNTKLSESMIKSQTGGEPILVRPLFLAPFEFVPTYKLILSFNNKPEIRAQDHGTWRRVLLVPFTQTIPEHKRIEDLDLQLVAEEGPGILNWLLEGWQLWRDFGLDPPEAVRAATAEYQRESDPLADWIGDRLVARPGANAPAKQLRDDYVNWAGENGQEPINATRWGKLMAERYRKYRSNGVKYEGVAIAGLSAEGEALAPRGPPV